MPKFWVANAMSQNKFSQPISKCMDNFPSKKRRTEEANISDAFFPHDVATYSPHSTSEADDSDPDYLSQCNSRDESASSVDSDEYRRARGKYKCGRCGQPKTNHVCSLTGDETPSSMTSIGAQTTSYAVSDLSEHPFITERTITVRNRKSSLAANK